MSDDKTNSAEQAREQQGANDWPKPGDEGYVHPDGTPQSAQQLADNRRAAADRAAAGSTVHGAPAATPGPQVAKEAEAAVQRAEAYSGPSMAEAREGVTEYVREQTPTEADTPQRATKRTADKATPDSTSR